MSPVARAHPVHDRQRRIEVRLVRHALPRPHSCENALHLRVDKVCRRDNADNCYFEVVQEKTVTGKVITRRVQECD
jgi:hypothetical protein